MAFCLTVTVVMARRSPGWAGVEVAVGDQGELGAEGQDAVGEALLGFEVADQGAAAELVDRIGGQLDFGGVELGGDVGHSGLFADHEDLGACCRSSGQSKGNGKQWCKKTAG
jgi:hypothetical protein